MVFVVPVPDRVVTVEVPSPHCQLIIFPAVPLMAIESETNDDWFVVITICEDSKITDIR
jgi:hypothetical protein